MTVSITRSDLRRVIVAIDPSTTSGEESDETGLVVVARGPHQETTCELVKLTGRCPGHGYVLDDRSCRVAPHEWAKRAVRAYDDWEADRIVAEVNNGGDMVGITIHAVRAGVPYQKVVATRGKRVRAEPVASLWEQGRMHLVGVFAELEAELTTWTVDAPESPGRLDAMVWGATALGLVAGQGDAFLTVWRQEIERQKADPPAPPPELRLLPRFQRYEPAPPAPFCAHRWFPDGVCVKCGGHRGVVAAS